LLSIIEHFMEIYFEKRQLFYARTIKRIIMLNKYFYLQL
jgi:hypothetical protein